MIVAMDALKLAFSTKSCFKVVVRSAKKLEPIVFLVNPYYKVLIYLMILARHILL